MSPAAGYRVVLWGVLQGDLNGVGKSLARQGCLVHEVHSLEELRSVTQTHAVDLTVARLCRCLEQPLLEVLAWAQDVLSRPQVLIVADGLDVDLYLEAMRRGAFDCVGLPLNETELTRIVARALQARHAQFAAAGGGR
jgi:DNA-binding NtrC family response regulator